MSLKDMVALRVEFDRCWPWLWESMCEFGPTHTKEQVWFRICAGQAFLWTSKACAIIGEFIDHPIGLRCFNYWLQGPNVDACKTLHAGIELWAKGNGAHQATGKGRRGWVRAMDGDWQEGPTERKKWLTSPPQMSTG